MKPKEAPLAAALTTAGYIVTLDGRPCTIANVSGLRRGGVLLPVVDKQLVALYGKLRDARRAVSRTARVVSTLRGSMIEDWARSKAPALFAGGEFAVVPVGRQK